MLYKLLPSHLGRDLYISLILYKLL